jgi:hypothetical protein
MPRRFKENVLDESKPSPNQTKTVPLAYRLFSVIPLSLATRTEGIEEISKRDIMDCNYALNEQPGFNILIFVRDGKFTVDSEEDRMWDNIINEWGAVFLSNSWHALARFPLPTTDKPKRLGNFTHYPILPSVFFTSLYCALNQSLSQVLFDDVCYLTTLFLIK